MPIFTNGKDWKESGFKQAVEKAKHDKYNMQAEAFMEKWGVTIECTRLGICNDEDCGLNRCDKPLEHDAYSVIISREINGKKQSYRFSFHQSYNNSQNKENLHKAQGGEFRPMYGRKFISLNKLEAMELRFNMNYIMGYTILASVEKYDPDTFDNFCANYGYDTDSRRAERIYFECQKAYTEIRRLFPEKEAMEELYEIN